MRYADLCARVTGLPVAAAGVALAGRGVLVAPPGGFPGIGVVGPAGLTPFRTATAVAGVAFVIAGLAVLVGRGRSVAVSVGGALTVAVVVGVAVRIGSPVGTVGVGAAALALLLSGAWIGRDEPTTR